MWKFDYGGIRILELSESHLASEQLEPNFLGRTSSLLSDTLEASGWKTLYGKSAEFDDMIIGILVLEQSRYLSVVVEQRGRSDRRKAFGG